MKKLISRVIGCALVLSIVATYFCSCSFLKSNKSKIEETVEGYWSCLISGDLSGQDSYVDGNGFAYTVDSLSDDYSELSVITAVLNSSEVKILENSVEGNLATATVQISSVDYKTPESRIKLDNLMAGFEGDGRCTEELSISFSKVDGTWLLTPDAVAVIKDFYSSVDDRFDFYGIPEAIALEFTRNLVDAFTSGDEDGILSYTALKNMVDSYSEESRSAVLSSYTRIFEAYFGTKSDFTYQIVENTDDTVGVLVQGSIVDTNSAWNSFYQDEEQYFNLILETYRYLYSADEVDIGAYSEVFAQAAESAFGNCSERTEFSRVFPVTYDENGNLQVYLNDMLMPESGFFMSTENEAFLALKEQALNTLLEEGTITQRQYNEAFGITSVAQYEGVDFAFTENSNIYSCTFSLIENRMIQLNIVTWSYFDEGTTFRYEVYKDDELIGGDYSYVMPDNRCDEIYPQYIFETDEDEAIYGNYRFVVYDVDGSTELITATLTLRESDGEAEEYLPEFPSTYATGTTQTYNGNTSDDIYYVHFENLINDQPPHFYAGSDGFDIYVCTWRYYNAGDRFVYAVYRDGAFVTYSEAYINEREGLDRIECIFTGDNEESEGIIAGDYTIVLYNINSDEVLLEAFLTVE